MATSMSHEGVRKRLKNNDLKPWQKQEWCIPKVSAEFVAHMEDVLDLYAEPYDPQRPVVCFDETSNPVVGGDSVPTAARAGAPPAAGLRVPPQGGPVICSWPASRWQGGSKWR